MLEWHDSLDYSLQCLNDDVSALNGGFGVPSMIHRNHSFKDDVSLVSRASSGKNT